MSKFKVRGVVVTRHEATSVSILCSDDIFQLLHIFDDSGEVGSEGGFRWFDAEAGTFYISQHRGWLCWFHPGSVALWSWRVTNKQTTLVNVLFIKETEG